MRIAFITTPMDWYLPHEDKSTAPPISGTGFYRCLLPALALNELGGHEVFICAKAAERKRDGVIEGRTWCPNENGSYCVPDVDVVITKGWMFEEAAAATRRARAAGQVVIGDLDDWYWGLGTDNIAFWAVHPKANPKANANHYKAQLGACDRVVCSTEYLTKRCTWADTVLIRNMIDLDIWEPRDVVTSGHSPIIGWTGGTLWRQSDIRRLANSIKSFMTSHGLKFAHVGHRPEAPSMAQLLGVDEAAVITAPQVPYNEFPDQVHVSPIDVGLVLMEDSPFNHAKSALKGMEYAACGIPFIAPQWHEEYQQLGFGRTYRNRVDFRHALTEFLDPEYRREVATANLAAVAQFDYRRQGQQWVDLINESSGVVAGNRAAGGDSH